jgi:hypothetical protein
MKVVEKIQTHILCSISSFRKSCVLLDNVKKYCRAKQARDDVIRRMGFACWIPKATNKLSEYVILIALPLLQWLHERVWILRYTYIVCIFIPVRHFALSVYLQES